MEYLHAIFARWLTHWYVAIPVYGFGAYCGLIGFFIWLAEVAFWLENRADAETERD